MIKAHMTKLINKFGQDATLSVVSDGAYDPETASITQTTTNFTVKAYFSSFDMTESTQELLVAGSRTVLMGTTDTSGNAITAPSVGDEVSGVDDTVRIMHVQKIYDGNTVVCYICKAGE